MNLGKQKRASLHPTDKAVAKRKLTDLRRNLGKVDASLGNDLAPKTKFSRTLCGLIGTTT